MATPHRKPTLKDVARAAGVSTATASRALSDSPLISDSTKDRVRKAASELGYLPNAQARALRKSATMTIGVVIPDLTNPFFSILASVIERTAAEVGYSVVLSNFSGDVVQLERSLRVLDGQQVDGIIAVPHEGAERAFQSLDRSGTPYVFVDRTLDELDVCAVVSNPEPGIAAAVELMARSGHTSIGYLCGPANTSTGRERRLAFEKACTRHGIRASVIWEAQFEEEAGREGTLRLCGSKGLRALIASDAMLGTGALTAFRQMGVVAGEDVAFIAFDDMTAFRLQPKPLTVIDQHVEEMGRIAFQLLRERMGGAPDNRYRQLRLDTTLVMRESVPGASAVAGANEAR